MRKAKNLCVYKQRRFQPFIDKDLGHICTNSVDFINSQRLKKLLACNLKFRTTGAPTSVFTGTDDEDNTYFEERTRSQLHEFAMEAGKSFGFDMEYFEPFISECASDVKKYVPEIIAAGEQARRNSRRTNWTTTPTMSSSTYKNIS